MDPDAAHKAAEELEHLHDRAVLDEFDDELEHPVEDAHGVPVPGEREEGSALLLSLLRAGDKARCVACSGPWPGNLDAGMEFTLGPRQTRTNQWTLCLPDGAKVTITHEDADRIVVERLPE